MLSYPALPVQVGRSKALKSSINATGLGTLTRLSMQAVESKYGYLPLDHDAFNL